MKKIRFEAILTMLNWERINKGRWIYKAHSIRHSIYLLDIAATPDRQVLLRYYPHNDTYESKTYTTTFEEALDIITNDFKFFIYDY